MTHPATATRVLGVLAGLDASPEFLRAWAGGADRLIAADAGADRLLEAGLEVPVVVGDLDSLSPDAREGAGAVLQDPSQDSSDCDKLLAYAHADGVDRITLINAEGDRPDHFLATLQSAARSPLEVRLALRRGLGYVLKPGAERRFFVPGGTRLSLLPLTRCEDVTLEGAVWPVAGEALDPLGKTSLSNRARDQGLVARIGSGAAFLFLEVGPEPAW
jgi:thiamine pyrophosphokinase